MATAAQRALMGDIMDWLVENAARVHYPPKDIRVTTIHEIRSFADLKARVLAPGGLSLDCSQMFTAVCLAAGLDNPNGADEDGFTGTLLDFAEFRHAVYSNPAIALTGAGAVFEPGDGEHVAMVRHPGKNPLMFNHGEETDPRYVLLSVEAAAHRPPVRMISIASL